MERYRSILCILLLAAVAAHGVSQLAAAADKIKIEKLDDLPRFTYPVDIKPSELLTSDEAFVELMTAVKRDVESTLETYQIDDGPTLQGLYGTLQAAALIERDFAVMLDYGERARVLEDKESTRATMGLVGRAMAEAHEATGADTGDPEFNEAFRAAYQRIVQDLEFDIVQDRLQQLNGQMQILSNNILVGMVQGAMDASHEKSGFLSGDQARRLVQLRGAMEGVIPLKTEIAAVLGDYLASHAEEKEDIWPDRNVAFAGDEGFQEIVVGVWDSGVDASVFGDRMYKNPDEILDGEDNDGNGFVDDVHGVNYDLNFEPTAETLYIADDIETRRAELENSIKGFMDLQAGIQSDEAGAIRTAMAALEPDEVEHFLNGLNLYGHYAHGTHVAGISVEGNPYAKILAARMSFDHRMTPVPFTMEMAENVATCFQQTVDYFKDRGVRVVNMSWGFSIKEIEQSLEANGIGADAEERGAMAREMFMVARKGLEAAFRSAPDICFVAAAGNSDNDVNFDDFIPSGFVLPNLMTVGAVDQAGQATGFTSFGEHVFVYGNGFEVDSYVPGGNRVAMSGTSMASPNVANLALKLLTVDPELEPLDVFRFIQEGAEDRGNGEQALLVIHPQKSLQLLKEQMGKSE